MTILSSEALLRGDAGAGGAAGVAAFNTEPNPVTVPGPLPYAFSPRTPVHKSAIIEIATVIKPVPRAISTADTRPRVRWIRKLIAGNVLQVRSITKPDPPRQKARRIFGVTVVTFVVVAASWSCSGPSGTSARDIVYEASGGDGVQVYRVDPGTGVTTPITAGPSRNSNPAWSPDGEKIVFVSDREDGQVDVHAMDADGSDAIRLTDTEAREIAPKFSPDGTQIAFARDDGNEWSLWVMNADGTEGRQVAGPYRFVEFPSWHPKRNEILYSAIQMGGGAADILRIDLDTDEVSVAISTPASDVCPHFSHDGKWLTYATDSGDSGEVDVFRHDLGSSATDGADDVRLTEAPGVDDYANYSPDDAQLVFVTRRDGESELYLMNADGSEQRALTQTPGLQENVPDW